MDAITLIKELQNHGVTLWIEGNTIRYKGPSNVITPDVLQLLKSKKQEIINLKKSTGYGCSQCGNKIYQTVQQWVTYSMPDDANFENEHVLQDCWQCEQCKAVYIYIGGSRGPRTGQ